MVTMVFESAVAQQARGALPVPDPATDHILGPDSAPVTMEAAGAQARFWPFHDVLFAKSEALTRS